jgi:hypothetical protein
MVASAERKDAAHHQLDKRLIDAIVREIAQGFAPVMQDYVRREIAGALIPLQAQLDEIEAELRSKRAGRR